MSKPWLRGGDQRRAKREKQVRADALNKFGTHLEPADVRRLALEIAAGEHGAPLDDYQRPGQSRVQVFAVVLDGETTYARYLVEQGELAGLMTADEWAERQARRPGP